MSRLRKAPPVNVQAAARAVCASQSGRVDGNPEISRTVNRGAGERIELALRTGDIAGLTIGLGEIRFAQYGGVERGATDAYYQSVDALRRTSGSSTESEQSLRLSKLETARRQLETAIKLYFEHGDEVSIHTLAAAGYSVIRDINEHRGGEPMLKDLHCFLSADLAREFRKYINTPENFLKHADKDPSAIGELNPRWTEALMWEASRKYCEMTGDSPKVLITFIFWFVMRNPGLKEHFEENCASEGLSKNLAAFLQLPLDDRRRFFTMLN